LYKQQRFVHEVDSMPKETINRHCSGTIKIRRDFTKMYQDSSSSLRISEHLCSITITILDINHHPAFYLKYMMDNVRTSQETYYVSARSPTG
jgi:hypothetical protein